jgi:hypothetical protein
MNMSRQNNGIGVSGVKLLLRRLPDVCVCVCVCVCVYVFGRLGEMTWVICEQMCRDEDKKAAVLRLELARRRRRRRRRRW